MSRKQRLIWLCAQLLFVCLFTESVHADEFYLPPSIYRTLSTRHRSLFAQPAFQEITITAHAAFKTDLGQKVHVTLHYGTAIGDYNSMEMSPNNKNEWEAKIEVAQLKAPAIYYYLQVDDSINVRTAPESNPESNPFKIDIDPSIDENAPPIIELMPRTDRMDSLVLCNRENILISAYVVDQSEPMINDVQVRYQIDDIPDDLADVMEPRSDYQWNILIPKEALSNSVHLQIQATDPVDSNVTYWPPDSSRFTINTSAQVCRTVPPFVELTDETSRKTLEAGGSDLPYQTPIDVEVVTSMPGSIIPDQVLLYYQPPFMSDFVSVKFSPTGVDSIWTYTIPAGAVADPYIKFFVELVDGKDEVTQPIWKAGLRHLKFPVKAPNEPPHIRRSERTRAFDKTIWQAGLAVPVAAFITDNVGPGVITAAVYFRNRGETTFTEEPMQVVQDSLWRAEIPGEQMTVGFLEYYIYADDGEDQATAPDRAEAPDSVYVIEVQNLNAPPVITLTPATAALSRTPQPARFEIPIEAFIVDTLGPDVQSALLHFRHDAGDSAIMPMSPVSDSIWQAIIPAEVVLPDTLAYYISATDGDSTGYSPPPPDAWQHPHKIAVAMDNELPVILHTPATHVPADSAMQISAVVIDSTLSVELVELHYRNAKHAGFQLLPTIQDAGGRYTATIPARDVIEPWIKYYLFAKGDFGPEDTTRTPIYQVKVIPGEVLPNPFTPNNDGYNDAVFFNFPGLKTGGEVAIYNMRGRSVRKFVGSQTWDGRDDSGGDVPPGVYIYAVTIDGTLQHSGTLTLIR